MTIYDNEYEKYAENDIIKILRSNGFNAYKDVDDCIKTNATFKDISALFAKVDMKILNIATVTYVSEDGTEEINIKVKLFGV